MKFENTTVMNFQNALRGMRNPKNSWHLSDTEYGVKNINDITDEVILQKFDNDLVEYIKIGANDMKLAQTLIKAGGCHRKFMRQIFVSVDITAPDYFFKEFSTYKVGTVENSTSSMHKIMSKPFTTDMFECNGMRGYNEDKAEFSFFKDDLLNLLNKLRNEYLETKDKQVWKTLIQLLPMNYLYMRTITMNYENLLAMCSKDQRRFHKLNEWSGIDDSTVPNFINWARTLPYAQQLIFIDEE